MYKHLDEVTLIEHSKCDQLIGEKECHCTQYCATPDIFCEDCEGTGTILKLQKYLKKYNIVRSKKTYVIKRR